MGPYSVALDQLASIITHWRSAFARAVTLDELEKADPYWLGGDAELLVKTGALQLPADVVASHSTPPTPNGFCWLDQPIACETTTPQAKRVVAFNIAALGWFWTAYENGAVGYHLVPWVRVDAGAAKAFFDAGLAERLTRFSPQLVPGYEVDWLEGQTLDDCLRIALETGDPSDTVFAHVARLWMALCLFTQQRITTAEPERADRATRRRLERDGWNGASDVRVIHLRSRSASSRGDGESSQVEWSCRWMVRGHWRNAWYPSLKRHHPTWIMPYQKGPEDAPLKVDAQRLFVVAR